MTRTMTIPAVVAASFTLAVGTGALAQDSQTATICEQGYSLTDVNDDGYISPIEMNAYTEKQASEMDADDSGTISRDEYVNCAMSGQNAAAAGRTEDDLTAVDADGDGTITQEEFMQAGAGSHAAAQTGDSAETERAQRLILLIDGTPQPDMTTMTLDEFAARSALLFMLLDQDRDTTLSREEFLQEAPTTSFSDIRNAEFDQADTDQSGDLTTTELIAANQARAERAMQQAEADTGEKADPERGAPVVYYRYPHPM